MDNLYHLLCRILCSFLQKIGVKCENHSCSLLCVGMLLGEDTTKTIDEHKSKRIDAQYYMKIDQKNIVKAMLLEAQHFILVFDELVSNLSETQIQEYRQKIASF